MKWHCTLSALLVAHALSVAAATPVINVVFPASGSTVSSTPRTYVIGSVTPPDSPLTVNSQTVTPWRTGGFLCMMPVTPGTNTFYFRAGKTELKHSFTVALAPVPPRHNAFVALHPLQPLGVYTGETVRLECLAPTGHVVFAAVGERIIPLAPDPLVPTIRRGSVDFVAPAEAVPIQFYADTLTNSVHAASITARDEWPTLVVTGGLFETRVRTAPGDGETAGFLTTNLCVRGAGFVGSHTRIWLEGRQFFVESNDLAVSTAPLPPRDLAIPDLSTGFGPHPPSNAAPCSVLVVLDPGHGGDASGAVGPCGVPEKKVALQQAFVAKQVLEQAGFRVLLTRNTDANPDLYERVRLAYAQKATAFIALHYNATVPSANPQTARHIATYYWNDIGENLARAIHPHIAKATSIPDGGIRQASFAVCRNPAVPSILLEQDFITVPEGEEAIQTPERQKLVARAILAGLCDWLGIAEPQH